MNVARLPVVLLNGSPSVPLSCQLATRCTGLDVEMRVTQTVRNGANEPSELTVHVPLTATAAVRRVEATLGGETIVATLEDKWQARTAYDMAIAANRRAALIEDRGGDAIVLSFGNVPAGEEASCTVVIDDSLAIERSGAQMVAVLRLPTSIPDRYRDVNGPTNQILSLSASFTGLPSASRTSLQPGLVAQDRELSAFVPAGDDVFFEFALDRERAVPAFALLTPDAAPTRPALPGDSCFAHDATLSMAVASAPESTSEPLELVVILDRSGSMNGWKQTLANDLAADLVERLVDNDDVAVFTFDTMIEQLSTGPLGEQSLLAAGSGALEGLAPASYVYRNEVARKLRATTSRDGTELAAAFIQVAASLASPRRRRVTVVLTDGQVADASGVITAASALGTVYSVAIGQGAHHGLLATLGHCQRVSSSLELVAAAEQLQFAVRAPTVRDVRVFATAHGDSAEIELVPAVSNPLVAGSCTMLYARCPSSAESVRLVLDRLDGSSVSERIEVRRCEPGDTARGRFARLAIRSVERAVALGRAERSELVQLSLAASVLCSQTAFVAIGREFYLDEEEPPPSVTRHRLRPLFRRGEAPDPTALTRMLEEFSASDGPSGIAHALVSRSNGSASANRAAETPSAAGAGSPIDVPLARLAELIHEVFGVVFIGTDAPPPATIDELERLGCAVQDAAGEVADAVLRLVTALRSNASRWELLTMIDDVRFALFGERFSFPSIT